MIAPLLPDSLTRSTSSPLIRRPGSAEVGHLVALFRRANPTIDPALADVAVSLRLPPAAVLAGLFDAAAPRAGAC